MNNGLVNFRHTIGLSQKDLAEKLGITLSFYSKIETGLRNPSFNFIVKMKSEFPDADINKIFFELKTQNVNLIDIRGENIDEYRKSKKNSR